MGLPSWRAARRRPFSPPQCRKRCHQSQMRPTPYVLVPLLPPRRAPRSHHRGRQSRLASLEPLAHDATAMLGGRVAHGGVIGGGPRVGGQRRRGPRRGAAASPATCSPRTFSMLLTTSDPTLTATVRRRGRRYRVDSHAPQSRLTGMGPDAAIVVGAQSASSTPLPAAALTACLAPSSRWLSSRPRQDYVNTTFVLWTSSGKLL